MKERPILFSAPMVRALLAGTKTQTRRIVKLPVIDKDMGCELSGSEIAGSERDTLRHCPYGVPGDRLWVRETFAVRSNGTIAFRAAPPKGSHYGCLIDDPACGGAEDCRCKWRPSIFMPRAACRTKLEITAVRVERLAKISERDAQAEGGPGILGFQGDDKFHGWKTYRAWYKALWENLNAKRGYGWKVNPWVWVITFRRL